MKKRTLALTTSLIAFLSIFSYTILISNPTGAPDGRTNSPADGATCNDGGCHGATLSTSTTILSSNIPANGYAPNTSYTFTVKVPGTSKKGFQVSPQKTDGTLVGTLTAGSGSQVNSSKYITHTAAKSSNPATWTFTWKSPAAGAGDVNFYGSFVNGQFNELFTQLLTVKENTATAIASITEQSIQIFPSPSNGNFNIDIGNISAERLIINLYDLNGKKVAQVYNGNFANIIPFQNSSLNDGMYLLNIETGNASYSKRIIINN